MNYTEIYDQVLRAARAVGVTEAPTPEVEHLLAQVFAQRHRVPVDLGGLRAALGDLFQYLTTPAGKTHANCWVVDLFLTESDWDNALPDLPDAYHDAIYYADALHDTVKDPAVAHNFGATPEQLLERLLQTTPEPGVAA